MPRVSVADNPKLAQQKLQQVLAQDTTAKAATDHPVVDSPASPQEELCGWYFQENGELASEFTVRELNGRDEEYFSRVTDPARFAIAILERGLVRVGEDAASSEVLDGLLAGDWDTILLAIRIATFGEMYKTMMTCSGCKEDYEANFDLSLAPRTTWVQEQDFEVIGKHRTSYRVSPMYGSTQRKILAKGNATLAEMNSEVIMDCLISVDGRPLLGREQALNMPISDRTAIIRALAERRVGPDLGAYTVSCPHCGKEDQANISIAATFRQ